MVTDPRDPKLLAWLQSLSPREELIARLAMRIRFPEVRGDRKFTARVDDLLSLLEPNEDEYASILREAARVGTEIA